MKTIISNIHHIRALILPVCLFLLAGCEDNKADYITLSADSFTFSPDGSETFRVEVLDASTNWQIHIEGDWIVEKEKDGNSVTIGATPTQSNSDRLAKLVFTAGDAVEAVNFSQLGTNVKYSLLDANTLEIAISPGGKYVAGVNSVQSGEQSYEYIPFIIETATGKRTEKPKLRQNVVATAISESGVLVLTDASSWTTLYYNAEDQLTVPVLPAGYTDPNVEAITSDGNIMVGYARKTSDRLYYPIKWTNGIPAILEVPQATLLGQFIDQGVMARGCSEDGSVIYGSVWDDNSAVYWKGEKVAYVGTDKIRRHTIEVNNEGQLTTSEVVDRPVTYAENTNLSPNGRYLATTFQAITEENQEAIVTMYPAVFDTETEELTILNKFSKGFEDGSGRAVSDEGILSYSCPAQASTTGFIYNINTQTDVDTPTFIKQQYGISFTTEDAIITRFTDGTKTLLGMNVLVRGSDYQYWYMNAGE